MIYNTSCETRYRIILHPVFQIISFLFFLSAAAALVLSSLAVFKFRGKRVFHRNAKILITLILVFSSAFSFELMLTYLFHLYHLLFHVSQCDLIFYAKDCRWSYIPLNWGLVGLVTTQMCLSVERAVSTALVHNYEFTGRRFGVLLAGISIVLSFSLLLYGLGEVDLMEPQVICAAIPTSTARTSNVLFYTLLFFDILSLCLFVISWYFNRKKVITGDYSLAKKYQVEENLFVIKLLFPMAAAHFFMFGFYMIGTVVLRNNRDVIPKEYFSLIGMGLYVVPYYTVVQNGILYTVLGKEAKRRAAFTEYIETRNATRKNGEKDAYFIDLDMQWNPSKYRNRS